MKFIALTSLPALAAAVAIASRDAPNDFLILDAGNAPNTKACPYELCGHRYTVPAPRVFNMTCWTHGDWVTKDDNKWNDIWLKSNTSAYVPAKAFANAKNDFETELNYCGPVAEEHEYLQKTTVRRAAECRADAYSGGRVVTHYEPEVNQFYLTCLTWGEKIRGEKNWYYTRDGCYVWASDLKGYPSVPDFNGLDACQGLRFSPAANGDPTE